MISRPDDRLFVFDDEERVAFVAQIVHHAHQPADVARMETDARLVHDEEGVDERRAETGREVDALDFAAAQRPRRAIEGEITNPDLTKVTQAGNDLVPQHGRGGVVRRKRQAGEKFARLGDRQGGEFRQGKRDFIARDQTVVQCLRLKPAAVATGTSRVSAVTAEQNADMHFVGLALEPFEKSAHAIPAIGLVIFLAVFAHALLAVDDEILVALRQFLERQVHVDFFPGTGAEQVFLRFAHFLAAKNAHRALGDGKRAIGNRPIADRSRWCARSRGTPGTRLTDY